MALKSYPSRAEIEAHIHEMAADFGHSIGELTGAAFLAIRNGTTTTGVEIRTACRLRDIYRMAATLVESTLQDPNGGLLTDPDERILAAKLADALMALAGDGGSHNTIPVLYEDLTEKEP